MSSDPRNDPERRKAIDRVKERQEREASEASAKDVSRGIDLKKNSWKD